MLRARSSSPPSSSKRTSFRWPERSTAPEDGAPASGMWLRRAACPFVAAREALRAERRVNENARRIGCGFSGTSAVSSTARRPWSCSCQSWSKVGGSGGRPTRSSSRSAALRRAPDTAPDSNDSDRRRKWLRGVDVVGADAKVRGVDRPRGVHIILRRGVAAASTPAAAAPSAVPVSTGLACKVPSALLRRPNERDLAKRPPNERL